MRYPEFFNSAPTFKMYDPLGDFLGAFEDGVVEISYLDCVKLAGHSCPTVAGAFLMSYRALATLYKDGELPARSGIKIELKGSKSEGVTGVIGTVCAFIYGASDEGGFSGIGGYFSRKNLLNYGVSDIDGDIRFSRLDNSSSVTLKLDTSIVGANPKMSPLMQKILQGKALPSEVKEFKELWQGRVEQMLTTPDIWDKIAVITDTKGV